MFVKGIVALLSFHHYNSNPCFPNEYHTVNIIMYGTEGFSSLHNSRQEARVCCFKSLWSRSVSEQQEVPPPSEDSCEAAWRKQPRFRESALKTIWTLLFNIIINSVYDLYSWSLINV